MTPITPLGSVRHADIWRCEQCGIEKPLKWYSPSISIRKSGKRAGQLRDGKLGRLCIRKSRYCSNACRGAAMTGKANPAYTTGLRSAPRAGRTRKPMTEWQVSEIERWMRLRDRTAQQLADIIGVTRRAVHKRASSIAARQQTNSLHDNADPVIVLLGS